MTRPSLESGRSPLELIFVAGLMTTLAGIAVPNALAGLDGLRTLGAVRYMASRLQQTRMEAVARSADAAMRFDAAGPSYGYAVYLDGNRNGVRTLDIQRGVDRAIHRYERLADHFPGVDFGALPGLPPVDPSSPPPGNDPIRFGSGSLVTFTPLGTSTPGSLYIRGRRNAQYVIRVFGATGKTRILKFDPSRRQWKPL